jgi:probable rRNA maturation factor
MELELDLQLASTASALPQHADFELWCRTALSSQRDIAELTIRVVDETEGRELNQEWRGKDYATNVLSFVAEIPPGILDIPLLGDLVICAPVVAREAAEQGKPLVAHWAHLVIHGCLHLLGHDHIEDDEAEIMESLERHLLASLGYPDPYREH